METERPASTASALAARLEALPMSNWQRWLTVIVGIGSFFDLYEVFLGGVLAPVLADKWTLSSTGKSAVIACAFTGMFVGASLMSVMADRFGRRKIFILNLASYAILSVASAFSPNLTVFVVLRFLCGVGVGSELVLVDTYLAEFLPARLRGRYIAWAYTVGFLGVPVAALIGAHVVATTSFAGVDGWRWLLIAGGLGAVFVLGVQKVLPESPRWLTARGRDDDAAAVVDDIERKVHRSLGRAAPAAPAAQAPAPEAVERQRVPLADMFRTYRSRTIMMWIFQILQTVGYYGFGSMAPLVLVAKGFSVTESLGYAALTYIGYPVGSLVSIPLVERFERKHLIIASTVGIGVFGLIFGLSANTAVIVAAGFLLTVCSNIFSNGFHIYQTEIFPTSIRSSAVGIAYSLSRATSAGLPFAAVPALDAFGPGWVFGGSAVLLVFLILNVALLGPRTTGRVLEEAAAKTP
ncbi:MAG: MFS transporter [Nocardiopsaceae bacterium]|nr:MFS transporter [Nocardiopsaceae bacterium]